MNASNVFIITADAEDMDRTGTEGIDRVVKIFVDGGHELIAVSDLAFYYVNRRGRTRFLSRDNLFLLLESLHRIGIRLARRIIEYLSSAPDDEKPYISYALVSDRLPAHLFDTLSEPVPVEHIPSLLAEYGRVSGRVRIVDCDEILDDRKYESVYRTVLGLYLDALAMIKAKHKFGVARDGPCLSFGGFGVVVL